MAELVRDPRLLPYYLTLDEASGLTRLAVRTLKDYCTRGILKRGVHWSKPAARRLFVRDALLAWMAEREVTVPPHPGHIDSGVNLDRLPELAALVGNRHGL